MRLIRSLECTICTADFELDKVGGIDGYFGVQPVAFCPDCYAAIEEMVAMVNEEADNERQ